MSGKVQILVVYKNPSDYPNKFVVREQWAGAGGIEFADSPLCVVDTYDEILPHIPNWMVKIMRSPEDDPVILESWL